DETTICVGRGAADGVAIIDERLVESRALHIFIRRVARGAARYLAEREEDARLFRELAHEREQAFFSRRVIILLHETINFEELLDERGVRQRSGGGSSFRLRF